MANEQALRRQAARGRIRAGHPQQLLEEIADAFYESADLVARLRDRIACLAEQISGRFTAEEGSGRFEDVLCNAPWLTARAQELQQQHAQLVESLHAIRRRCESSDGPVSWWLQLQQEFTEFAELLREHEVAELSLLQEVHPGPEWSHEELPV